MWKLCCSSQSEHFSFIFHHTISNEIISAHQRGHFRYNKYYKCEFMEIIVFNIKLIWNISVHLYYFSPMCIYHQAILDQIWVESFITLAGFIWFVSSVCVIRCGFKLHIAQQKKVYHTCCIYMVFLQYQGDNHIMDNF